MGRAHAQTGTARESTDVVEPALLIRIARLYRYGMTDQELYEVTRGVWRVGPRREGAQIALSVVDGEVVAAYQIDAWHIAGSTRYTTRAADDVCVAGRWEFSGTPASEGVWTKYVGRSVAHYFQRGAANPITYVNV